MIVPSPMPSPSARDSLRIARPPLITRLIGKAMALGYRLAGKDRYDDFRLERVNGVPFIVMPTVFNPKVPRTGEFLASLLDSRLVQRDWDVLDMGTGSGVCAVFAAKHARRVVAVDINPAAVRCASHEYSRTRQRKRHPQDFLRRNDHRLLARGRRCLRTEARGVHGQTVAGRRYHAVGGCVPQRAYSIGGARSASRMRSVAGKHALSSSRAKGASRRLRSVFTGPN